MTTIKHKVGGACEVSGCTRPHYGRGLCKPHHQWRWTRGLLGNANEATLRDKLEHYAMPVPESGCWLWTGATNNRGYGRISAGGGRTQYAHRIAYIEFKGGIPDGFEVCHKCDTPSCCNPDHLFIGSHWENMRDASSKGRMRTTPSYGTDHVRAVLTAEQVVAIRMSHKTALQWATEIGCHPETIRKAKSGRTYQNVDGPSLLDGSVPFHEAFGGDAILIEQQAALLTTGGTP